MLQPMLCRIQMKNLHQNCSLWKWTSRWSTATSFKHIAKAHLVKLSLRLFCLRSQDLSNLSFLSSRLKVGSLGCVCILRLAVPRTYVSCKRLVREIVSNLSFYDHFCICLAGWLLTLSTLHESFIKHFYELGHWLSAPSPNCNFFSFCLP